MEGACEKRTIAKKETKPPQNRSFQHSNLELTLFSLLPLFVLISLSYKIKNKNANESSVGRKEKKEREKKVDFRLPLVQKNNKIIAFKPQLFIFTE